MATALYACLSLAFSRAQSFLLFHSTSWMSHCSFQCFLWQGLPNFWKRLDAKYFKCIQLPDLFPLADVNNTGYHTSRMNVPKTHTITECLKDPGLGLWKENLVLSLNYTCTSTNKERKKAGWWVPAKGPHCLVDSTASHAALLVAEQENNKPKTNQLINQPTNQKAPLGE